MMSDGDQLQEVILWHQQRYPRMQIRDLVKLVYQNEFAGGHMIADAVAIIGTMDIVFGEIDR